MSDTGKCYDKDCDHIYGNMGKWPRKCFRCGGDEADIQFDRGFEEIEKAIERGKTMTMPEEYVIGDDYGTPVTYILKSTVDAQRAADSKTIAALAVAGKEALDCWPIDCDDCGQENAYSRLKQALSDNASRIAEAQEKT